jgi:hypothetical protein
VSRVERVALLALCVASAMITAGPFWLAGYHVNDNHTLFGFFRNHIDSLHRFGEPAFWFPKNQGGYPGYFYSLLGILNGGKPVFVGLGSLVWLAGRLGLPIPPPETLYVAYYGALVPALFVIGVWSFARQVFRSRLTLAYVTVVAAFSPGVLLNLSDIGVIEHTAYGLFVAAAFLAFVREPSPRHRWGLLLAVLLLLVAPAHMVLVTVLPFLPLFLIAASVPGFCFRRVRRAFSVVRPRAWVLAGVLAAASAAPSLVAIHGGRPLLRRGEAGTYYEFRDLKPGSPLEVLIAGTPGLGMAWDEYVPRPQGPPNQLLLQHLAVDNELGSASYVYLGLLCLPLAVIGLVVGRYTLRMKLLVLAALAFGVMLLSGYSPFFAAIVGPASPLRSMNHYSDLLYRGCGFLIPLFAAGLGLEAVMHAPRVRARTLAVLLGLGTTLSLAYLTWGLQRSAGTLEGLAAVLASLMVLVLVSLSRESIASRRAWGGALLVALTLVDVATVAFWLVRMKVQRYAGVTAEASTEEIAETLLVQPEAKARAAAKLDVEAVPVLALYTDAPIPADARVWEAPWTVGGRADLREATYNTWQIGVDAPQPARLFLRDTFSPYWHARVDGRPVPVLRAPYGFKAVDVPAGQSQVDFDFSPPGVALALAAAYMALLGTAFMAARSWRCRPGPDRN